jgi:Na+-transporting NADH:ubiquinone oxidoreductase subunit B
MKAFRDLLDAIAPTFEKGGRLEKLFPLWEAADTFFYSPASVTRAGSHVRDALDLKRMMTIVVIATLPCVYMACWNTGLQANLALDPAKAAALDGWRHAVIRALGVGFSPQSWVANVVHGALYFVPLYVVTMVVGLGWEVGFAIVRRLEVNEGFFVTGILYALILPPQIPLWQAAVGISFGVVLAKEVFGGTGMNFVNPALAARAFVFFAYPASMSGDVVWTAIPPNALVDGYSGATALATLRQATAPIQQLDLSWTRAFLGVEPGSLGETSALACLAGAALLLFTRIASWRIMAGVALGTIAMSLAFNAFASPAHPYFFVPWYWHMVLGGWAFGTVFMATDPVTAPFTDRGRWIYGVGIGALIVMVRTVNPAYPESTMLVILFMNVLAPLIDYPLIRANIKRRALRHGSD